MEKTPEQIMAEWALEDGPATGRKLRFREQCAAFALLYGGTKPFIVARAFGVSGPTISYLGGCLEQDPTPWQRELVYDRSEHAMIERTRARDHNKGRNPNRIRHYEMVAREFEALGVQEFNNRYLTEDILARVDRARAELRAEKRAPAPSGLNKPLTDGERLANMSTKQINDYYAEHPELDPRNH